MRSQPLQRESFLTYRGLRYFKLAALLVGASLLAAVLLPARHAFGYGGSTYGFVLGSICALMVALLAWYGIRKRRPPRIADRRRDDRRRFAIDNPVEADHRLASRRQPRTADNWRHGDSQLGWLSAHCYLGGALLLMALLHSGLHFGWNIHTLALVMLVLVTVSGVTGGLAYLQYPRQITENNSEESGEDLLLKIAELDEMMRVRALDLPDEVNQLVTDARNDSMLHDGLWQRLAGSHRPTLTDLAVARLEAIAKQLTDGDQPALVRDLYALLLRKKRLMVRATTEVSLHTRMQFWIDLHGPLSLGLLSALAAHVATILIYW